MNHSSQSAYRLWLLSIFVTQWTSCKSTSPVNNAGTLASGSGTSSVSLQVDEPGMAPSWSLQALQDRAKSRKYWPGIDGDWQALSTDEMATRFLAPQASTGCAAFHQLMFPPAATAPSDQLLKSDGVLVVQGGKIVYEYYDNVYAADPSKPFTADPNKRHSVWSASKSLSTGIAAAIAQIKANHADAINPDIPFDLNTSIKTLSPQTASFNTDPSFGDVTVQQLLDMSTNLQWFETYSADIRNSNVTKMLWLEGFGNMAAYAASQPFWKDGANKLTGSKFTYSSGNALILMHALKNLYQNNEQAYQQMPWDVLFKPIGMKNVVIERDQAGTFIGSSYVHTTLRDLAKFGYLYLNGGYYNGQQVLHPEFVTKARVLSSAMVSPTTTEDAIQEEGSFYSMGFWINPSIDDLKGVRHFTTLKQFFPNSPNDVFFAAGHYGQLILIFPSQDLMLVRFAHDVEYFSKLDAIMSQTQKCFVQGQ